MISELISKLQEKTDLTYDEMNSIDDRSSCLAKQMMNKMQIFYHQFSRKRRNR